MSKKIKKSLKIVSQEKVAEDIYSMWLQADEIADNACAGQFVSLYTRDGSRLLPRPISICEIDRESRRIRLVYRVTGKGTGTEGFSRLHPGVALEVLGPLGNGFPLEEAEGKRVFLMGGGIGIPPMLETAKELKAEKTAVLGYRNELFLNDEFKKYAEVYVSTEDGSAGTRGNVLDAVRENALDAEVIFACGPAPMLRAIKAYALEKGIPCWISMEERMACGIGACLACVCQSSEIDEHSQVHNKTCLQRRTGISEYGGGVMMKTSVALAGVELKNPVMTASGTFGSGMEYSEFVDLNRLGAVVTKGVANVPWPGNPTPRVAETAGGMLNAIGLQNPGIDVFCKRDLPFLKKFDTKVIVNVCGKTAEDYCEVVERLGDEPADLLEINVSCPNVKEGGIAFGQNPKALEQITREVKKYAKQPVIMKLSPNVTDITEMAKAAEAGGADVLSLINTLTGMKIDINKRTFALANKTGGMSGPAVKPIAVRMVYQVANAVNLPIIGMGGIATAEDALEFIMAGATAVSVGTANFYNPYATVEIADGIEKFMKEQNVEDIRELIGAVK